MKKTLLAIAACAASTAFAENSVTLYGIADAWVGSAKHINLSRVPTAQNPASNTQAVVQSGGLSGSRVGVKVREDIGDGLSAFAVLEAGANIDDGSGVYARKSVLGLAGNFGTVSVGRQSTPYDDLQIGTVLPQLGSTFDGPALGLNYYYGHATRYNNSIRFDSPNMNGLSGSLHLGLGEDKGSNGTNSASLSYSGAVRYSTGPLDVGLAYQEDETGPNKTKNLLLGGAYDFGVAKLNLGYNQGQSTNSPDEKAWLLGASVPMGPVTVIGSLGRSKLDSSAAAINSASIEAQYALSKRTTAYLGAMQVRQQRVFKDRKIGTGVRHVF